MNQEKSMINMKNNISKLTQKITAKVIQSMLFLTYDYATYVYIGDSESLLTKNMMEWHS